MESIENSDDDSLSVDENDYRINSTVKNSVNKQIPKKKNKFSFFLF